MIRVNISNLCAIRADQSRGVLCHMQYIRSYYFNKLLTIQKGSSEHECKTSLCENRQKKRVFSLGFCCVQLISQHHLLCMSQIAQWHGCLHFSMSLNSQHFLQFHPTITSVVYFNSCFIIISQASFLFPFSSRIR